MTRMRSWLRSFFEIRYFLGRVGRQTLDIKADTGDMAKDLAAQGIKPFIACQTTRRKYKVGEFLLDMDLVAYDEGSTYTLAEIEAMVENQSDVAGAIERIHALAQTHGCTIEPIRGKVVQYLMNHKRDHFEALVKAGVIKE